MKLISKAKPVKIRIKSGGEEHSSLDSLKRNFNISDIQPLLDGRLVRWLKQQGENELTDVISKVNASVADSIQGVMYLMKIFFAEYIERNNICDVLELVKLWLKSPSYRKNGENLFYYITWNLYENVESLDAVKYLYKHKNELNCPKTDWFMVFILRENENEYKNDPEVLYIVGKMLWEGYQFNDIYLKKHYPKDPNGLELIEKAARLGCQEANLFIFEYNRKQKEQISSQTEAMSEIKRFDGVNKDRIRAWMRYNWGGWNIGTLTFSRDEYPNDKERNILDFLSISHYLGYISERLGFKRTLEQAKSLFAVKDTDILKKEKRFIIGLLCVWAECRTQAKNIFTEIKDYKLANYMLGNTRIIDQLDFKSMSFQNQLTFIKDHLFDYE